MANKMLVTQALEEKRNTLLTELDTQIKVSNATTFIEIDQKDILSALRKL